MNIAIFGNHCKWSQTATEYWQKKWEIKDSWEMNIATNAVPISRTVAGDRKRQREAERERRWEREGKSTDYHHWFNSFDVENISTALV